MSAAMVGWLDRHTRACVWTLAMVAVALRALLAAYSPWSFGYVWDLYHEAIQRLYATGHLPVSTDCWECWQPPLLFLASWPLYAIGRIVYPTSPWPDDYALRFVGAIPLAAGLACVYYTCQLLRLTRQRRAWLVLGFGVAAACPLLFFSSYSIEPDILLAGLLAAFIYYLMRWHLHPHGSRADIVRLGVLAGLAAATKYNGLSAVVAGTLVLLSHISWRGATRRGLGALVSFLVVAMLVGGWKYVDNERRYGTPLFANGDAGAGFSLSQRMLHTRYEFTTFRLPSLLALTRPDAPDGMLTDLPVYRSFWTTFHGLVWGDMGFFTNPTRHGTRYPFYHDRHIPPWLASAVLVLGIVPSLLAIGGLLITVRRRAYLPITIMSGIGWAIYLQYVLSQEIWAIKAKYLMFLLPAYVLYAVIGLRWVRAKLPDAITAAVVSALAALIVAAHLYLLRFALG
jgi:4-amino-4-deoxy-L-arabinose transferase-like glycosyltransferase